MRDVIVGTAGHIDHGKTTLLKALTGIDADRLEEEKRRGITIDIGFAHRRLGDFRVGFIDVPGHEKFVKNMLSGIGGIDLVLLVVASDESVMPQTVEHFQICRLLGVSRGVIVLTKKNKVDSELRELVEAEVRHLVEGTFLQEAPCVAVDSPSGEGIDQLEEVLLREVEAAARRSQENLQGAFFRMPVDRVFSIRGFGTVVTGTPHAGRLQVDEPLQAYPGQGQAKVRGIEIFNEKSSQAQAGQRAALNLAGLEKSHLQRGMILAPPASLAPSHMLDVQLSLLEQAPASLKHRAPVRFHHGSGEAVGRIYLLESPQAERGETAICQVRLDTPIAACCGDRFILRRYSPMETIGGGIVIDPAPPKHRRRHLRKLLPLLKELARQSGEGRAADGYIEYALQRAGRKGIDVQRLAAATGLRTQSVLRRLEDLEGVRIVGQDPPLAVLHEQMEALGRRLLEFLERFHDADGLATGASREELKKRLMPQASAAYFQDLLNDLEKRGRIRLQGGKVGLRGREVELTESQQALRRRLLNAVAEGGWNPPTLTELCQALADSEKEVRDIYYYLLEQEELVRINEDLVLPASAPPRLIDLMHSRFQPGQPFSVADFKDLLGVSRKFAIPYLEFLDRIQATLRTGDQRILKKGSPGRRF
ncbi:MAG TPA: selenocysteine-specific translation elongation factor [Acidobacteriota bacterium]|nr:selenocysteine-specific translation elongation factor [Acidobacteriota bacterium]